MQIIKNYINGKLVNPLKGNYLDNYNPAEGIVYSKIPDSDETDIHEAVKSAKNAFPMWSVLSAEERATYLRKISNLILDKLDYLAQAESIDNGKPLSLAKRMDIPRAAQNFSFFADAATQFSSGSFNTPNNINTVIKQPIGVVGCISPWNLPLYLFTWKIAPALAVGCTVVAKPSEITPMTAYLLSEICIEAGLPAGVLNIVHGLGAKVGQSLVKHKETKAISFTGGTETGKAIASIAAPMFKKLSLELGGKNPNIVFADADFDLALETSVKSSFTNQGQICLCGSRIFVEESIYEKFKTAFVEKAKQLKVGHPKNDDSKMGAIVSKAHFDKILSYIKDAKNDGGKILTGGEALKIDGFEKGWYIAPTVIEGLSFDCKVNMEEIFGPVVTLTPFKNQEEVLEMANVTEYGLSATIWTQNINKALQTAEKLESGIVWINTWLNRDLRTPFGGVKQSGQGREGGFEAMNFFCETKNVCIKY
jgi:aminomuconate-semialdehyde/2-hydroxymuconate-6-semialdehyde dehydrogenase